MLATEGQSDRQLLERFLRRHDEVAFEALVQRHGPMVLGVCRRVLGNEADAEDAFQATFLVLARKAQSVVKPELLAGWLFGVAWRVARKARAQVARRRKIEADGGPAPMSPPDPLQEVALQEMRVLLDEELQRLPRKYQAPLVLCYLEGLTNQEAARQLGWPIGSMSYRLARGRQMLRDRMGRRNRSLAPFLLARLLDAGPGQAVVPSGLVQQTVQTALAQAAGKAGLVPPFVADLANKASKAISSARYQWLFLLAILAVLALGATALAYTAATGELPFGFDPWGDSSVAPAGGTSGCH
jgi:RNA polymerase sigma factor (sigma-70 family)